MKPKPIGIIGGAGPLAGVALLERIFQFAIELYGCHNDDSFPLLRLCSFPFSDMLSSHPKTEAVKEELRRCLRELLETSQVIAIACNTLHAFLDEDLNLPQLIHLPKTIGEALLPNETPLVFCTSTSVRTSLYKKFIPCDFPDKETQHSVDSVIDATLKKGALPSIKEDLINLLGAQKARTIILGCTELSLFSKGLSVEGKIVLDPLDILAKKVVQKSFSK